MNARVEKIAELLAEARQTGVTAGIPSDLQPHSTAEAYAIQDRYARRHGVRGWKVGQVKPGETEPFCSVLITENLYESPVEMSASALSNAQAELEVGITIGRDLPGKQGGYTADELSDAIASVHLAFEIIRSNVVNSPDDSKWLAVADHQGNHATIFGQAVLVPRSINLSASALRLVVDGKETVAGDDTVTFDRILESVAWLANHAVTRGLGLKSGDRIITGARVGPLSLRNVRVLEGRAEGFPTVRLRLS